MQCYLTKMQSSISRIDVPPRVQKVLSIVCAVCGLWTLRNVFWKIAHRVRSYPPGPLGLPYFGCFFGFGLFPASFVVNVARSYGAVAYVPLLLTRNLFVADPAILRQLYKKMKITARPHLTTRKVNAFGVLSGEPWSSRRKYAMETVLTLAKSSFILSCHRRSLKSAAPKIDRCAEQKALWFPGDIIHYFSMNASFATIFDSVLDIDDPFVDSFNHSTERATVSVGIGILIDLFSNYSGFELFSKWFLWPIHDDADDQLVEWMKNNGFEVDRDRKILKRVKAGNLESNSKGTESKKVYADFLIDKLDRGEMEYDVIWAEFESMFAASIDTQAQTSKYGFLLLAKFPQIQQRVYDEIVSVMESHGLKEFEFKIVNELHVFRAFIHEMLRISCAVPLGLPHYTTTDVSIEVDGTKMVVPKYTVIHSNTLYMQRYMDWKDGRKPLDTANTNIHLEYWLDAETGRFKMNDNLVAFGVGKRDCVGRSMAMRSMMGIFALFLLRYKFVAPQNDPDALEIRQKWALVHEVVRTGINVELRDQ